MSRLGTSAYMRLLAVAAAGVSVNASAESDAEARFRKIEQLVQQLQQERAEQDKRINMLVTELGAVQAELVQEKTAKVEERGKSVGTPVLATTKEGLVFEDGSGDWKLQINGRVQTDYRAYEPSAWKDDTFSIRRARFGSTFTFLQDYAVRVEGEYANDNTGTKSTTALTYGYLDYTRYGGAKIRVGQFKPFFGLERAYSTNFLDFTELSLATNNGSIFNSTYDRGVMLYGNPVPWVNYNVYAVNGTGQNNDDSNDGKDMGGRLNANFASLVGMENSVIHAGASASTGNVGKDSISQTTEAMGITFFNVKDLDPDSDRDRYGLETAFAFGPVKMQSEYIDANFNGVQDATTDFDNDLTVWYVDLDWLVTGESYASSYKNGVFGRIVPKDNFLGSGGWGAFDLGLRYSSFDASEFRDLLASDIANASEATAWTAGAKWILNPNARVILNYVHTEFDDPGTLVINNQSDDNEDAVILRAQYDY